jgi:hypothetical protein
MFKKLTYKWANAIFGGIALILIPVPFVSFSIRRYFVSNPPRKALFLYGPSLRKRSTMCSQLMQAEEKPTIESRDGEPWPPFRSISNCLNFLHPSWTRYSSLVTDALADLYMSFRIIVYITFLTLVSISCTMMQIAFRSSLFRLDLHRVSISQHIPTCSLRNRRGLSSYIHSFFHCHEYIHI